MGNARLFFDIRKRIKKIRFCRENRMKKKQKGEKQKERLSAETNSGQLWLCTYRY